ncbi:MAG TPA: mCpol domain-containing protein [Caldilineaceae bacterium]|nr:mCpol domain-containing protein [Caldilineaceae bacterium]
MRYVYMAVDGDDIGPQLRTPIINNDIEGAAAFSRGVIEYFAQLRNVFADNGCEIILCAGDSLLARTIATDDFNWLSTLPCGLCTVSIGIGASAEYAYLALQLAKARGKRRIVRIDQASAETFHVWNNDD